MKELYKKGYLENKKKKTSRKIKYSDGAPQEEYKKKQNPVSFVRPR